MKQYYDARNYREITNMLSETMLKVCYNNNIDIQIRMQGNSKRSTHRSRMEIYSQCQQCQNSSR